MAVRQIERLRRCDGAGTRKVHMRLQDYRRELPVIAFSAAYMALFVAVSLTRKNYEFILYAAVVVVIAAWILIKQTTVRFTPVILWGLALWGLLHMAGGNVAVGDSVLYNVQLIPRVLRYDQFVHAFGFGTATLVCFHILQGMIRPEFFGRTSLAILVMLMGCGVGAMNEIVEFLAVKAMPETNVGGYDNTLWDLIFNTFGAGVAAVWAVSRKSQAEPQT